MHPRPWWCSLEPLREQQRGSEEQREQDGQAPSRRRSRSSQPLDQLLHQAEQGEDRHCQQDEYDDAHVTKLNPEHTPYRLRLTVSLRRNAPS